MRIMGLDYGSKTVGVAISDALRLTAQAVETIERKEENKLRRTCARIEELIKKYDVEKIVLGFPKHMNNDIGERAQQSMEFGEMLKRRTGLEVILWDERLTTVEAERTLIESALAAHAAGAGGPVGQPVQHVVKELHAPVPARPVVRQP